VGILEVSGLRGKVYHPFIQCSLTMPDGHTHTHTHTHVCLLIKQDNDPLSGCWETDSERSRVSSKVQSPSASFLCIQTKSCPPAEGLCEQQAGSPLHPGYQV
jgi:hypothetical protein